MDKDFKEYKDFDMSGATRGVPSQVLKLKNKNSEQLEINSLLDKDVTKAVEKQANNPKVLEHINLVIEKIEKKYYFD